MWIRILAMLLFSLPASADEGTFTFLQKKECAPFDGVLFDGTAVASLMAEKENWKLQCDLEVEYNLDKIKTEFDLERKNLNIRYTALEKEYKVMVDQKDLEIATLQDTLKKRSPQNKWVWFSVGGAFGASAAIVIAKQFVD